MVTWKEISPELASGVEIDKTWTRLIVSIIMIVVFLGIASAQLTAVLERRREFAILSALGMKNSKLIHIMFAEGLILGLLGGILGIIIGAPFTYLVYKKGIDFSSLCMAIVTSLFPMFLLTRIFMVISGGGLYRSRLCWR